MPRILVIEAHPDPASFGAALAQAYAAGASAAGATLETLTLAALRFDPILRAGHAGAQALEPALLQAQEAIQRADHLVFQLPVWWGSMPAVLKGFIDRVFLPGWAFQHEGGALPRGLLAGRSARVLATMDSPWWWYWLKHSRAAHRALIQATLHYVGIQRVAQTTLYKVRELSAPQREAWLQRARDLGAADARRLGG